MDKGALEFAIARATERPRNDQVHFGEESHSIFWGDTFTPQAVPILSVEGAPSQNE
jgi:hypothetical protein